MSAASAVNTLKRVLAALLRVGSFVLSCFEMEGVWQSVCGKLGGEARVFSSVVEVRGGSAGRCNGMILLGYLARNYWYACL